MDWAALVPVASPTIALLALAGTTAWNALQARTTNKTNHVTNMWKFCDSWDSAEMKQVRGKAAQALQSSPVKRPDNDIHDVLSFFEKLGFLLRQKAIDMDAAWSMFSDWALPYHKAAAAYIKDDQEMRHRTDPTMRHRTDPTIWEDFGYLNQSLLRIEATRRHKTERAVEQEIDQGAFLTEEAKLASGQAPRSPAGSPPG